MLARGDRLPPSVLSEEIAIVRRILINTEIDDIYLAAVQEAFEGNHSEWVPLLKSARDSLLTRESSLKQWLIWAWCVTPNDPTHIPKRFWGTTKSSQEVSLDIEDLQASLALNLLGQV